MTHSNFSEELGFWKVYGGCTVYWTNCCGARTSWAPSNKCTGLYGRECESVLWRDGAGIPIESSRSWRCWCATNRSPNSNLCVSNVPTADRSIRLRESNIHESPPPHDPRFGTCGSDLVSHKVHMSIPRHQNGPMIVGPYGIVNQSSAR